ncbi:hypothetical protein BD324DRAFT_651951 [Kockovaella imperatae]|uniref:ER transporter 6TM N-terminal domain-containing protein n=1 Tax=Kockovaella imperatae TaxID=4999 RepID=A0A1Y1UET3_9TREE|nr:hypothetical protein BD324DRAFT_651951 [Kockovaella imperatae]ORX36047.1 hypothetical protein BD324DRAFT_651951 [Kockovaella imperatae]
MADEKESESSTKGSKMSAKLPPWLLKGLKNGRQWKTFIRCLVALFAALILMLCNKTLQLQGQAAFFSLILAMIIPPSFALSLYIFAFMTLAMGMLFGWAWGCASMASAIRARDKVLLASQYEKVESGFSADQNIDAQFQESVFRGAFLDPRSSTVMAVFFFVGTYFLAWIRATKPRLQVMLFCLFGTILLDVMSLYGPLFPTAQYLLPRILLIPTAFYFAIALATTLLIFPQSLNHQLTTSIIDTTLRPILSQLKLQDEVLKGDPGHSAHIREQAEKARGIRRGIVAAIGGLQGQMAMLQLEVTRGQISGANLAKTFDKVKQVGGTSHVLASFIILLEQDLSTREHVDKHGGIALKSRMQGIEKHRKQGTSLQDLFPILESSTRDLRQAIENGISGTIDWLNIINHSRWKAAPKDATDMASRQATLDHLRETLAEYRKSKSFELLEQVKDLFDPSGDLKPGQTHILRSSSFALFRCHVFTTALISFGIMTVELLEFLLDVEKSNPRARIQWPAAFAKMLASAANDREASNPLQLGTDNEDDTGSELTLVDKPDKPKRTWPKDADAEDPRNGFQRFGRSASAFGKRLISPQGLFALKYAIISVALQVPFLCHNSAFFVYSEKGLWAVIMAQMGLGVYPGEQIAGFVARVIGTAGGLINGMVIWYIGAPGKGHGNPYGIAAATMVFVSPFMFIRLVCPPQSMAIWLMIAVMSVFVVGYSWVDEHVVQVANSGAGAALAGRRALLVLIGFAAAFIIMLFPRPLSAKRDVRLTLARCISSTSDLYSYIIQSIENDTEVEDESREKDVVMKRIDRIRGQFVGVMGQLSVIEQKIAFASFEPGVRGPWPKKRYEAIFRAQLGLLNALALLGFAHARLKPQWARRLERTNLMNPDFIADSLHHFYLLHSSLEAGRPLPVNTSILERLVYHSQSSDGTRTNAWKGDSEPNFEQREEDQALAALGQKLTWNLCHDEQMSIFAATTVAMTYVASGLEELTREIADLVGETSLAGLDRARERRA